VHVVDAVFIAGWAAFWIYWLAAAFTMKRGRVPWSRELGIRVVIVIIVIVLVHFGVLRHRGRNSDPWLGGVGLVLFAIGLFFAVWARLHIGRNWGMPMTEKHDPELVTSGPYRLVRHPIYSGILLAGLGTAVAVSWMWLIAVALAGFYFGYSSAIEERFLARSFPGTFPAYKASTNRLLPFIY
jgi:protein-S-isoprenylcysteine O-methyltransferase Ste14